MAPELVKRTPKDPRRFPISCRLEASLIALAFLLMVPTFVDAAESQCPTEVHGGYLHPKDRYHYDLHEIRAGERVSISLSNVSGILTPSFASALESSPSKTTIQGPVRMLSSNL